MRIIVIISALIAILSFLRIWYDFVFEMKLELDYVSVTFVVSVYICVLCFIC